MKRKLLIFSLCAACVVISCKSKSDKNADSTTADSSVTNTTAADTSSQPSNTAATDTSSSKPFDINSIKVTDKLTGTFPYFKLPPGYHYTDPNNNSGKGKTKDYDKEYFYNDGRYVGQEGKTFKADIQTDENKEYSKLELQKSFDELINNLGGVNLNNGGTLKDGEKDQLEKKDPNAYSDDYLHSCNNWQDVHTYVLRASDKIVWVQYNLGGDEAYITILETKPFVNQMTTMHADQMKEEISQKGKVVLHINFDTDKASLKSDGKETVLEMAKVLKGDPALKLSIQGHTDSTGSIAHNKQLSLDRANTVKGELVSVGINKDRLSAIGFGSEKPVAPNDTEEDKAMNRRVEFVKV